MNDGITDQGAQMVESDFDIKSKVLGILESVGMNDTRAAKCDLDDFLK